MMNLDYYLFQQINGWASHWRWLDISAIFFASYFQYLVVLSLILVFKKQWQWYIKAGIVVFLSRLVITEIIRWLYYRPRPFVSFPVHQLIFHETVHFPPGMRLFSLP